MRTEFCLNTHSFPLQAWLAQVISAQSYIFHSGCGDKYQSGVPRKEQLLQDWDLRYRSQLNFSLDLDSHPYPLSCSRDVETTLEYFEGSQQIQHGNQCCCEIVS